MIPESVMRELMRGADTILPSSTIARPRPTLAPVASPNSLEPSAVSRNWTTGSPNWPREGLAFLRSRPVITRRFCSAQNDWLISRPDSSRTSWDMISTSSGRLPP
jgi:hypothetical protein